MNKEEISKFLQYFENKKERTIVVIDYGNVDKWKEDLNWNVDIQYLGNLIKYLSINNKKLRRFYYGEDCGPNEKHPKITEWSKSVLERAEMNKFEVVKKRVKYIHDNKNNKMEKKCDLDVEMAVDLIKEKENYDYIILFSGDGDLMYVIKYLFENFNKKFFVFAARDHIAREIIDGIEDGFVESLQYVNDYEYRLNKNRLNNKKYFRKWF